MLYEFVSLALYQEESWACELVSRVSALVHDHVPSIREWLLSESETRVLHEYLSEGGQLTVRDLLLDPWHREEALKAIVLLIHRRNDRLLLPDPDTPLKVGDRLLLCGNRAAFTRIQWTLSNRHTLDYMRTGEERPQSWIWRELMKRRRARR